MVWATKVKTTVDEPNRLRPTTSLRSRARLSLRSLRARSPRRRLASAKRAPHGRGHRLAAPAALARRSRRHLRRRSRAYSTGRQVTPPRLVMGPETGLCSFMHSLCIALQNSRSSLSKARTYTSKTGHSKGIRLHTTEFVIAQLAFAVSWQRHSQYSSCGQHFDGRVMMEGHMPF